MQPYGSCLPLSDLPLSEQHNPKLVTADQRLLERVKGTEWEVRIVDPPSIAGG